MENLELPRLKGYRFACEVPGRIIIERFDHVRGHWHVEQRCYRSIPSGDNAPTDKAADIDGAVRHTLLVISNH